MNDRESIQSDVAAVFSDLDSVNSVVLVGSTARGFDDEESDIDFVVFCDEIPDRESLTTVVDQLGASVAEGELRWHHDAIGYCSFFDYGDSGVDITYYETEPFEQRIRAVLRAEHPRPKAAPHDVAFGRSDEFLAGLVRTCQILSDEFGDAAELKELVEPYPEVLTDRNVRESYYPARFYIDAKLKKAARRDDFFQCNSGTARVLRHLTRTLFAVNNRYFVGDKHNEECLEQFDRLPVQFFDDLHRLRSVPESESRRRIQILDRMTERTGTLLNEKGILQRVEDPF